MLRELLAEPRQQVERQADIRQVEEHSLSARNIGQAPQVQVVGRDVRLIENIDKRANFHAPGGKQLGSQVQAPRVRKKWQVGSGAGESLVNHTMIVDRLAGWKRWRGNRLPCILAPRITVLARHPGGNPPASSWLLT